MRLRLVAVALALVTASCGGSSGPGVGDQTGPAGSVRIEIEQPPAAPTTEAAAAGAGSESATRAPLVVGSGAADATPSSTGPSGAASSVVAHAVVPEVVARSEPDPSAPVVAALANPIPVGTTLVFLVVDDGPAVADWVEVLLPVQPNGTTGWVERADVALYANPYRIEVDRASHRLRVFEEGNLWVETAIAVGTGATPTPVGRFYLLELLAPPDPDGPYGPYAFGLSGFSEVLDSFGEADTAIIGLHGTDDPSAIGSDVSFGCIRVTNDVIEQLAAVVPLGTPVVIT